MKLYWCFVFLIINERVKMAFKKKKPLHPHVEGLMAGGFEFQTPPDYELIVKLSNEHIEKQNKKKKKKSKD
jgi:hypothetical protein